MAFPDKADQDEVIAFLGEPSSYRPAPASVECIETHGAIVFLAGKRAYKIKRAVRLAYLDFSTLEKRRRACEREVEVNRTTAPDLYAGTIPIVRRPDGALQLGGEGEVLEWAVEMARFDQEDLLDRMAAEGRLRLDLMVPLTDHIAAYHAAAPVARDSDGVTGLTGVIASILDSLGRASGWLGKAAVSAYAAALRNSFDQSRAMLARRAQLGYVRRCHGDLHLRNIVLLDGRPTLFDAIEFDEALATIDTLYDLAFLLMDLWHRRDASHANLVLNRYLWRKDADDNIAGLALMPLFLSVRAGVRAMVALDRLPHVAPEGEDEVRREVREYFALAASFLAPPPPRLVAVGGLSGTGKSTLAAALAPMLGAAPGALHLRSDVERKLGFGVAPEEALPASAYTSEVSARVYATLNRKAALALAAGHSAILDAVFARPCERAAAERVAAEAGASLGGLWLTAPEAELVSRVEARCGDASDADAGVVRQQLSYDTGEIAWARLDAGGTPEATLRAAAGLLGLRSDEKAPT